MKNITKQKLYRLKNFLLGKSWYYFTDMKCDLITAGNSPCEWTFSPGSLNSGSIIYSFGVGNDISFERYLVHNFGVKIYLFDPTPASIEYIQSCKLSSEYVFESTGIAEYTGKARFFLPEDSDLCSCSLISSGNNKQFIEVDVERLSDIIRRKGHNYIDLLKMDIEGAEYSVIKDILNSGITINQLLIEFHHRLSGHNIKKTNDALRLLRKYGYKLVYVSPIGEEFTLIKENRG